MAHEFNLNGGPAFDAREVARYIDDSGMPSAAQVRQSRILESMSMGNWAPFWRMLKQKDKGSLKGIARAATVFESLVDEDDDLRRHAKTLEALADVREATGPDFYPYIIGAGLRTRITKGYTNQEIYWPNWCATDEVEDFETHDFDWLGGFGSPPQVAPGGEYPEVKQSEYKGTYSIKKYGVTIAMQWEQKLADKLNAFGRQLQQVGAGFATLPDILTTALYTGNAVCTYDNVTLLHASSHGANKVTDALSESAVSTGIGVGLSLTDYAGNKAPVRYRKLMVYPSLHDTAIRICQSQIVLATGYIIPAASSGTSDAGTFSSQGNLNPVATYNLSWFPNPYLTTATDWALHADPATVPCITKLGLQGYPGILFFSEARDSGAYFERDILRWKVVTYDGAYIQDHRMYGRVG